MRHILIRSADLTKGGEVMTYTATEIAELYTAEEVACLAIGNVVLRGSLHHVDLLAFHDRHAAPGGPEVEASALTRGSVFLRHKLRAMGLAA
jgi:hypothetical protein